MSKWIDIDKHEAEEDGVQGTLGDVPDDLVLAQQIRHGAAGRR